MSRFAVVKDGVVVNVARADSALEHGWIASDEAQIGWTYSGGVFTAPASVVEVPQTVSMRQARLALLAANLLNSVEIAMQSADQASQIEWEYATEVQRNSPLVVGMTAALGWTSEQVDALFISASAL